MSRHPLLALLVLLAPACKDQGGVAGSSGAASAAAATRKNAPAAKGAAVPADVC